MSSSQSTLTKNRLSLTERLGLIGLIHDGMRLGSSDSPLTADLFSDLWELVHETVSGSRISQLRAGDSQNGFHAMEINGEAGENLGRLNMLYLKKPIPCYYLVYVEVASPFRRKGLGNRILRHFGEFLCQKSALGLLDNIIPEEDPTNDIYTKQQWVPVESVIRQSTLVMDRNYMLYIPPGLRGRDLKDPVLRLLHHLSRKRAAIDIRDNELMVQRTIAEFRDLYAALSTYFREDLSRGKSATLMRFMFTRFVTKFISFRRRITGLIGYTGGESLEQIILSPEVLALPIQSYAPQELADRPSLVSDGAGLWDALPEEAKRQPARLIEALPNYQRPTLMAWLREKGRGQKEPLSIGDLVDLGFDPTRLKEIALNGEEYIFERIPVRQLPDLERKKDLLNRVASEMGYVRSRNANLKVNRPLLVIQDRGNAYVLRRKIMGIHWEEALEQVQASQGLKAMNALTRLDRLIVSTVREANTLMSEGLNEGRALPPEIMAYFVSWDLKTNYPVVTVDETGTFFETVWAA